MVHFKLSPNEEARILKEERERRRKIRIQQVREQSKLNAAKLRQSVNDEKERLLRELAEQLQAQWMREKQLQVQQMEQVYDRSVSCVGEGHRQAADEQIELQRECRTALQHEDWLRAQQRYQIALQRQSEEVKERQLQENKHVIARQAALELERVRSAAIASLPPPPHDPLDDIEPVRRKWESLWEDVAEWFNSRHGTP